MTATRRARGLAVLLLAAAGCGGEVAPEAGRSPTHGAASATLDAATEIDRKWEVMGGTLGAPTSPVVVAPFGLASYRTFEQGAVVHSDDWGAVAMSNAALQKWLSFDAGVAVDGRNLLLYVGPPIRDSAVMEGREVAEFERGAVVVTLADGIALAVTGPIYGRWTTATIGWPTGEEGAAALGGRRQAFEAGEIYWRFDAGAHSVAGAIRDRWLLLGGPMGVLGYPTTEPAAVGDEVITAGSVSRFQGGAVFESAAGAWEVRGKILEAYEGTHGGPTGWLGLPISGQGSTPTSGGVFNDFENGIIVSHADGPYEGEWAFNGLDLHLGYIQGTGDDCWQNVCGGMEVFMVLRVSTSEAPAVVKTRYPADDDEHYGSGADIDRDVRLAQVVHGDFWAKISVHGFDWDPGSDDDAGWVTAEYSVDNLFGIMETGKHSASDGPESFDIWIGTKNEIPFDGTDFVGTLWWSYDNWDTPYLTYDQYAATFSDVGANEEWWTNPLNKLYFEIYSHSAKKGTCFGMTLESIYAQLGRSLWAEPIHRFFARTQTGVELDLSIPAEKRMADAIAIRHGYQLGAASLAWRAGMILDGLSHDPKAVFQLTRLGHELGDRPLIGLTSDYLWENAHSVRPYRWDTSNPAEWKMFVADPNCPTGRCTEAEEYISIDPDANTFVLQPDPDYPEYRFAGGKWSGGRMFYDTFAVFADEPVTPAGQVMSLLNGGAVMILGSTGRASQITDGEGRQFFGPGAPAIPERWDQIQPPGARIPGLARIPISATVGEGASAPEVYYGKGDGGSYRFSLLPAPGTPAGAPYAWELASAKLSAHVELPATPGVADQVSALDLGTPQKRLSVGLSPGGTAKEVDWTVGGAVRGRWATLGKLKLQPGQTVTVRLARAGYELQFENDGPETTAELVVDAGPGAPTVTVGTIAIPGGTAGRFAFDAPLSHVSLTGGQPGNDGWSLAPYTVTLTAQDFSGLGISAQECSLDGAQWVNYGGPFAYAEEGATTLHFRARDGAGGLEVAKTRPFRIDTRAPVLQVGTGGATYDRSGTVVVQVQASDPVPGSGLAAVTAVLDGTAVSDGQAIDLLRMGLGTHTLTATATDVAGWTTTGAATFTIGASLAGLREAIRRFQAAGEIEPGGIARSLLAHVAEAEVAQGAGDTKSTVRRLEALLRELAAQSPRHVSAQAATLLEADARYVIASLG